MLGLHTDLYEVGINPMPVIAAPSPPHADLRDRLTARPGQGRRGCLGYRARTRSAMVANADADLPCCSK